VGLCDFADILIVKRIAGAVALVALASAPVVSSMLLAEGEISPSRHATTDSGVGRQYDPTAPYHVQVDPQARNEALSALEEHQTTCDYSGTEPDPEGSVDVRGMQWYGISCVDWKNIKVPGSACGIDHDVQLRNGRAEVPSPSFPDYDLVGISVSVTAYDNGVVYGDLDNDGFDEAAVSVWCDNRGGTAAGQLGQEWVIFTDARTPRVLGSVSPQHGRDSYFHVPYIGRSIFMAPGLIVAQESFYGNNDATCCPSGVAITTWSYSNGKLEVKESVVVDEPIDDLGP
jgi:hypothetical protein